MLNHINRWSYAVHQALRPMVSSVVRGGLMPRGGADSDIIVGKYRSTAFGVHRDASDNFSFVVAGEKRFLLWRPGSFSQHRVNTVRYHDARKRAVSIKAVAGECVFGPGGSGM